jgi:hypothetical protein
VVLGWSSTYIPVKPRPENTVLKTNDEVHYMKLEDKMNRGEAGAEESSQ